MATWIILLLEAGLYIGLKLLWSVDAPSAEAFTMQMALPASWSDILHQPWRMVTYAMIHLDFSHLLVNCLWIAWFGSLAVNKTHSERITGLFLAGAVAGAVAFAAYCAATGSEGRVLVGASAATLSLIVGTLTIKLLSPASNSVSRRQSLTRTALYALAFVVLATMLTGAGQIAAHIGGIAAGIAIGAAIALRYRKIQTAAGEQSARPASEERRSDTSGLSAPGSHSQVIDKVRTSGFASLSEAERKQLF